MPTWSPSRSLAAVLGPGPHAEWITGTIDASAVEVTAEAGRLTLEVHDDGVGITGTGRRSGLANARRRAERHGGTLTVIPGRSTGTHLSWTLPV